jgi:hypothetical protein
MMFMLANGLRNVSYNTLTSKVVEPELRARFQSLQSAVQHGAGAVAAFTSAQMLARAMRPSDLPGTSAWVLVGMDKLAAISMGLSAMIPLLMLVVEMRLTRSAAMVALPEPAKR